MDTLKTATADFERTVAALPPNSWNNDTPCDITVREVVDHVVAGNIFAVRLLAGACAADAVADLDADHLGDDALAAVVTSGAEQLTAFAAADQTRSLHHPSRDISYQTFVRFRLGELVIHAWDLAVGADLDRTLNPVVAEALWAMVEPHLDDMRSIGGYGSGPSSDLPPTTTLQTRLLDAFGRRA
ncbi:maleylpyruvate isomerase family mycothiol-dependent enzyme [Kribbella sp. NPDC006257]|uniref:maleylpyruvate isomerase family mycothiol-dependent enzyme n=1 Tax=Kribbella sp. NPDC006257 TaxID=3156738 RepID=UPI0033A5807B